LDSAPPAAEVAAAPGQAVTPTPPGAPNGAAAAGARNENYSRNYAVGREVSVTRQQSGTVKRLSVAVALKNPDGAKPRSAQEIAALEKLVKGAVGYDQSRGDVVALSARAFAPVEAPVEAWHEAPWIWTAARHLTAVLVVALFVFGLGKPLLKRTNAALVRHSERQAAKRTSVGGEIAAAVADQARTDPNVQISLEMIESARSYETRAALIRNFVRQDPARAALVVRDLIRADAKDGDKNG